MLLTYMILYFNEVTTALSRSPKHLQQLSVNNTARNISRSSMLFVYYSKKVGRGILATLLFPLSDEGIITSGILLLIVGWAVGIWAIATKTPLSYDSRVSVGVGFAVGVPAMIILWVHIWHEDIYAYPEVFNTSVIMLALLLVGIGVSTWPVFRYAPLPYEEKVRVAVGMDVGVPCLFTLWVILVQREVARRPLLVTLGLLAALVPTLWAIIAKTGLDQSVKVSLSIGLGIGLPCLIALVSCVFLD